MLALIRKGHEFVEAREHLVEHHADEPDQQDALIMLAIDRSFHSFQTK